MAAQQSTDLSKKEILLKANGPSHRMMIGVERFFDKFLRKTTVSLRNLAKDLIDAKISRVSCLSFGKYIESTSTPSLIAVFSIKEWKSCCLFRFDISLMEPLIDVILGGRNASEVRATPQSLTPIEKTLVEKFVGVMLVDFASIFSEATPPIHCLLERVEFVPRFALLFHEDSEIILTEATFSVGPTQGMVDLVMPHTLFSHLHDELPKLFVERETLPQWQSSLQEEVSFVPLELSAVLREITLPLQETLKWKIGTYLPLGLTSESLIHLVCENRPLLSGAMGQKDHRVAIRVQKVNEGPLSC